jgi:hypothetical protein
MKPRHTFVPTLFIFLAFALSACGSGAKFVAPEIEPPPDLIPSYVPEGFELVKGYELEGLGELRSAFAADDCGETRRQACGLDLAGSFFNLQSPAGNDILGVHYQDGDHLLLITRSYFPGGSLDLWRASFEGGDDCGGECECDCQCCCGLMAVILDQAPLPLRLWEVSDVTEVAGTQVAILEPGFFTSTTVFMRGETLLTVQGDLPLQENLKVVASLLGQ